MKKVIKEIIALLLALIILTAVLWRVSVIVTPKQHEFGSVWGHFLSEDKDSIDVLFFGSSIVYCDVVPAVYWQNSSLTAFVHAGPEQTLSVTAEYVRESMRSQSPKAIFVECTGLGFERTTGYTKTNIGQMPWGVPRLHATFTAAEPELIGGLLFPLLFYHDRWQNLKEEDYLPYEPDMTAGYTWLEEYIADIKECDSMKIAEEDWIRNIGALETIYSVCSERGIKLVLYRAPVKRLSDNDWQKLCNVFESRDGVYMLNCPEDREKIGEKIPEDRYDVLHYNGSGARKFSEYLGHWTMENLDIKPRENQDEELWNSRIEYFENLSKTPMRERKLEK